jgi:hypothetical protein
MAAPGWADPAVLFFVLGIAAGAMRSNLEIPPPISRFLSLYLLMALGLKGGFALASSGLTAEIAATLGAALVLAIAIPLAAYALLRGILSRFDAAAIAATYGSVSAVTFITATQYLDQHGIAYGGHMAAALALMESPAIVMAVFLANAARKRATAGASATPLSGVMRESLTDGAQVLLLGAMVIGVVTGSAGESAMKPFMGDIFRGMLAFFLLDMGLLAAKHMPGLRQAPPALAAYAIAAPLVHAGLALLLGKALGLSSGNLALLMTLAASASYIAVPAALRHAVPEANPALYLGSSLGLTFPFNILVGIPLYTALAS